MKGIFIGTTTIDLIYPIDKFPTEDTKTNVTEHLIALGGPATNAALTFAALGGQATLVSPIGSGPWSPYIRQQLKNHQITHYDLADKSFFSPTVSSVLVNTTSGLRTVITAPGSINEKSVKLPSINMSDYQVCCLDGFHAELVLKMLPMKLPNLQVVFDGGSYKNKTDELMALVDYPIFSERFSLPDKRSLESLMEDHQIPTYAITRGHKSIEMYHGKNKSFVEVPKIKAIDTLAAGDIFHGAFSYYILATNGDFRKSLIQSIKIASLSCQFLGPVEWMPHYNKV